MNREAGERATAAGPDYGSVRKRAVAASAVVLGSVAALYIFILSSRSPAGGERWGLWPVVAIGVWAAARCPVQARDRRMSMSVGLAQIPVLVGIAFLAPLGALGAAACGLVAADVQGRRPWPRSLVAVASHLFAVAVGVATYDGLLQGADPVRVRGLLVTTATVAVVGLVDLAAVVVAMAVAERRWRRPPLRKMSTQLGVYVGVCTAGGLVAVSMVWVNTWAIGLFAVIAAAANMAYRSTVVAAQRYANLEKLYEFTRRLNGLSEGRDVVGAVLDEARRLFSATRAELVVPLGLPAERLALKAALDGEGTMNFEEGVSISNLDNFLGDEGPVLLNARGEDGGLVVARHDRGVSEAMAAPLQRDEPGSGYLLLSGRGYQHDGFALSDLRFFETLAANAGVALRSSELLEQLRDEVAVREYQAHHDSLTGLPNRLFFSQRLEEALMVGGATQVAVMLIDLDGFKDVNDTLGHVIGDAVLREVAHRLSPFSGPQSVVARLGGDEFAVLLSTVSDELVVEATANQVLEAFSQPFALEGLLLDVRASMGVALATPNGRGRDASNVMRHADIAMYLAKGSGGGLRFYDPSEDHSTLRRLTLATELRRALESDELDLWYQPVVQLGTGEVLSCEALLRWNHQQFGPVSPVEFIPVAESAGLIDPITWWVLDRALAQVRQWRSLTPRLSVSVNLSARSLATASVPDRVAEALHRADISPEALTLELTESCMVNDPGNSERAMRDLRDIGVSLAIDDYGTGFSSLSRLKHLPFKDLKIDRTFVKEMIRDRGDEAIVQSTIELARSLGRTVTAEGVEDKVTLQRLASLGCNAAQGFYLARPLPAPECEAWLSNFVRWPIGVGASLAGLGRRDIGRRDGGRGPWPGRG